MYSCWSHCSTCLFSAACLRFYCIQSGYTCMIKPIAITIKYSESDTNQADMSLRYLTQVVWYICNDFLTFNRPGLHSGLTHARDIRNPVSLTSRKWDCISVYVPSIWPMDTESSFNWKCACCGTVFKRSRWFWHCMSTLHTYMYASDSIFRSSWWQLKVVQQRATLRP